MAIEKIINDLMEADGEDNILEINSAIDKILEENPTPTEEVLFGSEEFTKLVNDLISSKSDESRLKLVEFLHDNILVSSHLTTYSAYTNLDSEYRVECRECGISMADVNLLSLLALSFGVEMADRLNSLDQMQIRYCIGYKKGRVNDAIWVFSGEDFQVKVYSRLNGSLCLFQSQGNDGIFGELIWKDCCKYLSQNKSNSTNSGLAEILSKYKIGEFYPKIDTAEEISCNEFNFDRICELFSIPQQELTYQCYRIGEDSICLAYDSNLTKIFVLGLSEAFFVDTTPIEFKSTYNDILSLASKLNVSALHKYYEPKSKALINYEVPPYSLMDKKDISEEVNVLNSLTYSTSDMTIILDDLGSLNYRLGIGRSGDVVYNEFTSPTPFQELFALAVDEFQSNISQPINVIRYKVVVKLQSVSKFK